MEKIFLFPIIFSLFFITGNAKANLQDSFNKKDSLNKTNCSWDSSQFYHADYKDHIKKYGVETRRFCVDYSNNTVFLIQMPWDGEQYYYKGFTYPQSRRDGFLNSGEATKSGYSYYLYQFNIEGNQLVRYSCETYGPNSDSCLDDNRIYKRVIGIKR